MKSFLLCCLLLCAAFTSFAQRNPATYSLSIVPTQLAFADLELVAERTQGRMGFGLLAGFRPGLMQDGEIQAFGFGIFGDYDNQTFANFAYNGATFGLTGKYLVGPARLSFLEADLFYRHWWFDNKFVKYGNVEGYRFSGLRSETKDVYGLKMLFGRKFPLGRPRRIRPFVSLHAGLCYRYYNFDYYTAYGTVYDSEAIDRHDTGNDWYLTPQLGIRLGFDFGRGVPAVSR